MGNVQSEQYTAEEAYELLLESPAELVKGELIEMVRPGARHGIVCGEVTFLLKQWNKHAQLGRIATNDSGVVTERGPDTVRGPDIYFIQNRRLPDGAPTGWVEVVPDLCIEVLSPNDRWSDVMSKVDEFLAAGAAEVWVIDPDLRAVHIVRGDSPLQVYRNNDSLTSSVLPEFECQVADLFVECD